MVTFGDPENYQKLRNSNLDFKILSQEYPGFICIDRRNYMKWPSYRY